MIKKNFQLFYFSTGLFDCQVLCLSYANITSFVCQIKAELIEKNIEEAMILFDKLLISGNGKNRFMAVKYTKGDFIFNDANSVDADPIYRQYTSSYLRNQRQYVNNSVLTEKQKRLIEIGCVI